MNTPTNLSFHPDAAANFNARGNSLLSAIEPLKPKESTRTFRAESHPVLVLTPNDLPLTMLRQTVDPFTMEVSEIAFVSEDKTVGLTSKHCEEVEALAEAIQKTTDFKPRVSRDYVRRTILDWLERQHEKASEIDLSSFILERANDALATVEVWVPLANLAVEREVRLDPVRLRNLSKARIDAWAEEARIGKSGSDLKLADETMEKLRQRIQGLAAAVITLRAESMFAVDKALEKAEETAALFRLLHPANSKPNAVYYCRPLGREPIETHLALLVKDGVLQSRIENTSPPFPVKWELSEQHLSSLEEDLADLRQLVRIGRRSDFSLAALEAIRLYSRSTLSRTPSDKLVYIFSSLESILLKDSGEPLQASIGDRLAFVLGKSLHERKRINSLVRTAYGWRSRFVHHGQTTIDDLKTLQAFMKYTWEFFLRLSKHVPHYQSKIEFIDAIDSRKYA